MQYVFLFGRTPALSAAELLTVLRAEGVPTDNMQFGAAWACVAFSSVPDVHALQRQLGGTVKIGEVIGQGTDVERLLSTEQLFGVVPNEGRMEFGISGYPEDPKLAARLRSIALQRKKEITTQGYQVRVVTAKTPALSSAAVKKNKLLTDGAELMVFADRGTYTLAVTKTVQDFEGFVHRDEQRTKLDAKSGMLPPQLARIMVNLAAAGRGATILDPFCGSGTVLTEARDLGYAVIGSDKSAKAVRDSEANLAAEERGPRWRLVHSDVASLEKNLPERNISAIVTEPFLGPPQHRSLTDAVAVHFFEKLRPLYNDAFRIFAKLLTPHGRVVFVFPAVLHGTHTTLYPFLDDILLTHGFRIVQPLTKAAVPVYRAVITQRNSLLYARNRQHIGREIVLLENGGG